MNCEDWLRQMASVLPFGAHVRGEVVERRPFGSFVRLDDFPDVRAIVEINNYRPDGRPVSSEELPKPGTRIDGLIVDHVEFNRQVRLRVPPRDERDPRMSEL